MVSVSGWTLVNYIPPSFTGWVVIDEVQRLPELLNEVHRLIETQHIKFVLTGSSARSLRKKGVNLLAGRALIYYMHPLTVQELGKQFEYKRVLQYGLLPALLTEPRPQAYLKAYVNTYLQEEVMQEGLSRNLGTFTRFLEVASLSQGQVLNMSAIAREVGINQKSISNYFDILDDLLIAHRVPVFTRRAKRQIIKHPKFYFFDVGIYQSLRPRGFIDSQEEIEGAALETLWLQSLRAINDYYEFDYQFYYWRTVSGVEVDFVAYGPNGLHAFEIKRTVRISTKDTKGLRAFAQDYPMAKLYLIYGGSQKLYLDNICIYPMIEALTDLPVLLSDKRMKREAIDSALHR